MSFSSTWFQIIHTIIPILIASLYLATSNTQFYVKAGEGKGPSPPTACGHFDQYGGFGAGNIWITQEDGELFCQDDECCSGFGWCGKGQFACMDCLFYYSGSNSPCSPDFEPAADFWVFLVLLDNTGKKWMQFPNGTIVDYEDIMYFAGGYGNFNIMRFDLDDDPHDKWSGLPNQPIPRSWTYFDDPNTYTQGVGRTGFDEIYPEYYMGNWAACTPENVEQDLENWFPLTYWGDDHNTHGKEYDIHFVDEEVIVHVPPGGTYTPPMYEERKLVTSTSTPWGTNSRPEMFRPETIWPIQSIDDFFWMEPRFGRQDPFAYHRQVPGHANERVVWKDVVKKKTLYRTRALKSVMPLLRAVHPIVPVTLELEEPAETPAASVVDAVATPIETPAVSLVDPAAALRLPVSEAGIQPVADTTDLAVQAAVPASASAILAPSKARKKNKKKQSTLPDASTITPAAAAPVIIPPSKTEVIVKRNAVDCNGLDTHALGPEAFAIDKSGRVRLRKRSFEPLSGLEMIDLDLNDPKYEGKVFARKPEALERRGFGGSIVPTFITNKKLEGTPAPTKLAEYGAVITPAAVFVYGVREDKKKKN